jgi:hypothetical protein
MGGEQKVLRTPHFPLPEDCFFLFIAFFMPFGLGSIK